MTTRSSRECHDEVPLSPEVRTLARWLADTVDVDYFISPTFDQRTHDRYGLRTS